MARLHQHCKSLEWSLWQCLRGVPPNMHCNAIDIGAQLCSCSSKVGEMQCGGA